MPIDVREFIPFLTKVTLENGKELTVGEIDAIFHNRYLIQLIDSDGLELVTLPYFQDGKVEPRMRGYLNKWDITKKDAFGKLDHISRVTAGNTVITANNSTYLVSFITQDPRDKDLWIAVLKSEDVFITQIYSTNGTAMYPPSHKMNVIGFKK